MIKRWFQRSRRHSDRVQAAVPGNALITLRGRSVQREVKTVLGTTLLKLAEQHEVDWSSNCRRGTCARCRCLVTEGMEFLSEPNPAEIARLEPEELAQGFRLGCQATIVKDGECKVEHAPYF